MDALHVTKGVMYLPITKNTVTSFLRAKSPPLPHHHTIHKTNHGSYCPHPFNRVLLLIGFNKSIVQICARKYEKNINNDSICWPPKQTSNRLIQKIKANIYYLIRSLLILYIFCSTSSNDCSFLLIFLVPAVTRPSGNFRKKSFMRLVILLTSFHLYKETFRNK